MCCTLVPAGRVGLSDRSPDSARPPARRRPGRPGRRDLRSLLSSALRCHEPSLGVRCGVARAAPRGRVGKHTMHAGVASSHTASAWRGRGMRRGTSAAAEQCGSALRRCSSHEHSWAADRREALLMPVRRARWRTTPRRHDVRSAPRRRPRSRSFPRATHGPERASRSATHITLHLGILQIAATTRMLQTGNEWVYAYSDRAHADAGSDLISCSSHRVPENSRRCADPEGRHTYWPHDASPRAARNESGARLQLGINVFPHLA